MSKLSLKWISTRAFLIATFISLILALKNFNFDSYSLEMVVQVILQGFFGGLFWGWILTKFLPKYFGKTH